MSAIAGWLCPEHGDFASLDACRQSGCSHARLAGEAPNMLAVLALIVEAHEKNDRAELDAYVRHARSVISDARPVPR